MATDSSDEDWQEFQQQLAILALGASGSVEVAVSLASPFLTPLLHSFVPAVDSRLRLRALLTCPPNQRDTFAADLAYALNLFNRCDWETRVVDCYSNMWCVTGNAGQAFLAHELPDHESARISLLEQPDTQRLQTYFDRCWEGDLSDGLLYENAFLTSVPRIEQDIIRLSEQHWNTIIQTLAENPTLLFNLPPRRFEELVAELLVRHGFNVQLTPPTRDGGYDILAIQADSFGKRLYLVECKRYQPDNPVDVSFIRALNGVVDEQRATAGMIVTTSRFTRPAIEFAERIEYRMSLRDLDALKTWMWGALT